MSNSISSAITTSQKRPTVPPVGQRQTQFEQGTQTMLDESRQMVENAVGQGQDLNPMIYQYLGLTPTYEDHSADISSAQTEFDAAQKQLSEAQDTLAKLKAIPPGMRTPAMKHQISQLKTHMPALNSAIGKSQEALGHLQTMPKTITGVTRSDPSTIPADSPFSPKNPLNQTAQAEAQMASRMATAGSAEGGAGAAQAIDPTLVHQWTQAEAQLNQTMEQRYGPDWKNSTVGQAAMSAFNRQKAEQYAQWNLQQMTTMQQAATGGFGSLQSLAQNQIALWQNPSQTQIQRGNEISNLAGNRLTEQQTFNQRLGMNVGANINVAQSTPLATAQSLASGVGSVATTPTAGGKSTVGADAWNSLFGTSTTAAGVMGPEAAGGASALNAGVAGDAAAIDAAGATGAGAAAADAAATGAAATGASSGAADLALLA
jgi:hypothetical protein